LALGPPLLKLINFVVVDLGLNRLEQFLGPLILKRILNGLVNSALPLRFVLAAPLALWRARVLTPLIDRLIEGATIELIAGFSRSGGEFYLIEAQVDLVDVFLLKHRLPLHGFHGDSVALR
jgi:hypothetical protein